MSTQIDLGPVLSIPKGDWNADTTYERLNMVRHNSASWICNVATSKGVEPTEDSTDWYLQVKDTSSVTSVNGMKGDVVIELTETETPPANDNSNRIATTEWVTDKLGDVDLSGIKDDTVLAAQNAGSLKVDTGELTSAELAVIIENNNNTLRELINTAKSSADAAQNTANNALDKANNITVPVTSVNGMTGAVTVGTVRTVNGASADASGNVTVSAGISTVKGQIGSAWTANATSLTLPSGGTWYVINIVSYHETGGGFGVSTASGNSSSGYTSIGKTYSGGTKVYAKFKEVNDGYFTYKDAGRLFAIRIS